MRKHHVTLWNRVNIARESERLEIVQKLRFEKWFAVGSAQFCQISEVVWAKFKILEIIDRVAQAAGNGIAAIERLLAKGEVKDRLMLQHLLFPVTVRHGQLVEVSQKSRRNSVFLVHAVPIWLVHRLIEIRSQDVLQNLESDMILIPLRSPVGLTS